jgi:hypothetical protein
MKFFCEKIKDAVKTSFTLTLKKVSMKKLISYIKT